MLKFYSVKSWNQHQPWNMQAGIFRIHTTDCSNNLEYGGFHCGETSTISFTLKLDSQQQLQYKHSYYVLQGLKVGSSREATMLV
jgi:hypothetical protein